jgi:hypothetical protein
MTPKEKFQRAVRVVMVTARWKKEAGVTIVLQVRLSSSSLSPPSPPLLSCCAHLIDDRIPAAQRPTLLNHQVLTLLYIYVDETIEVVLTSAVYVRVCCPHTRCVCMCMLSSHTCPFIRCQCRRVEYHRGGVRQVDACTHGRDCTAGAQRTLVSAANTGCMCSNYSPDACFSCLVPCCVLCCVLCTQHRTQQISADSCVLLLIDKWIYIFTYTCIRWIFMSVGFYPLGPSLSRGPSRTAKMRKAGYTCTGELHRVGSAHTN